MFSQLLQGTLSLLFFVANSSGFRLHITNLAKIKPNSPSSKRVYLRLPSIFFKSSSEPSDERIKASPSLSERAWTRGRRIRVAVEWTYWCMNFGLSKLIQVPQKFKNMSSTAPRECQRWLMVFQVLTKGTPVSPFLVLVSARIRGR